MLHTLRKRMKTQAQQLIMERGSRSLVHMLYLDAMLLFPYEIEHSPRRHARLNLDCVSIYVLERMRNAVVQDRVPSCDHHRYLRS